MKKLRKEDYTVGWICALPVPEWKASRLLLDEEHEDLSIASKHQYVYGSMNKHNIVMGCLPATQLGIGVAAAVAAEMDSIFPALRFGLLVGVGGGVPSDAHDIRLGDVVVSQPDTTARTGGVIQYDLVKRLRNGALQNIGSLNQPPYELLSALSKVQSGAQSNSRFYAYLDSYQDCEDGAALVNRPQVDRLFKPTYLHVRRQESCVKCDQNEEVERPERRTDRPFVHYGTIASGNQVMKDAKARDRISKQHGGVLCFEMEAAGLMNQFRCLVIRGICDYADSHKNKDWQPFAAAAAAAWAKELLRNIAPAAIVTAQGPRPCSTVPFARSPDFVGRQDLLDGIDAAFSHPHQHNRAALTGLGGIGKSRIAIEYSYKYQAQYPDHWIFWVHASTKLRFVQAYQAIARTVEAPGFEDPEVDVLRLVQDWLQDPRNGRWLLILDNADDVEMFFSTTTSQPSSPPLHSYIPQCVHGAVLITSRNDTGKDLAGGLGHVLLVGQLDVETAKLMLRRKLPSANEGDATKLVEVLERIPLAIAQAAAYISQTQIMVSMYLDIFNKSEEDQRVLLSKKWNDIRADPEVPNTVITSWRVSFEQIRRTCLLAAEILSMLSMFDRQGIPEALVMRDDRSILEYVDAAGVLLQYSLIFRGDQEQTYSMHRLVQVATRTWLDVLKELALWQEKSLIVMSTHFPDGLIETWRICEQMLPHAEKVLNHNLELDERLPEAMELLQNVGGYYRARGNYSRSVAMYLRAVAANEAQHGPNDEQTLLTVESLSHLYNCQGRYKDAATLLRRVIEGYEALFGPDHPHTLEARYNLADVEDGASDEAMAQYERALTENETTLGPSHHDTLRTAERLALLYCDKKRYEESESLFQRALAGFTAQLGSDHRNTLDVMEGLASLYHYQERYHEAGTLYARALLARETQHGSWHPNTLNTADSLAAVYASEGRYEEAEGLYARVLEGQQEKMGPEHPDTLTTVQCVANLYRQQGRLNESEALTRRALAGRQKHLGPDHPNTLASIEDLATTYMAQDRYREADTLYRHALQRYMAIGGPTHPGTVGTIQKMTLSQMLATNSALRLTTEEQDERLRVLQAQDRLITDSGPPGGATGGQTQRLLPERASETLDEIRTSSSAAKTVEDQPAAR